LITDKTLVAQVSATNNFAFFATNNTTWYNKELVEKGVMLSNGILNYATDNVDAVLVYVWQIN
jgi:hypothetical protein